MSVFNDITIKIILSLLSIIIFTCVVSLIFDDNKREGFDAAGISNDITNGWNKFKTHMDKFGSILIEDFEKIFASIGNNFRNGFGFLGDNIEVLGHYFECGAKKIENFGDCFIFYVIDIICDLIYSFFYIIFAIVGQTWILDKIIDFVKKMDCALYDAMGFHIFQYPQTILDHCFLCPNLSNSNGEYISFIQPPPPDNPELEDPFDEFVRAFS